jgi:hypothetical protein
MHTWGNRLLLVVLLADTPGEAVAAFERLPWWPRMMALTPAGLGMKPDPWMMTWNPAGFPEDPGMCWGVSYLPSLFGIPDISQTSVFVACAPGGIPLALSAVTTGGEVYRETMVSLHGGWSVFPSIRVGFSLRYGMLRVPRYGGKDIVSLDLAGTFTLWEGLRYSILVANINAPGLGDGGDRVPVVLETALAYTPGGGITVAIGLREEPSFPLEVDFAAEFEPLRGCSLRVGGNPGRDTFCLGGGIGFAGVHCDYGFSLHMVLGATHMFGLAMAL